METSASSFLRDGYDPDKVLLRTLPVPCELSERADDSFGRESSGDVAADRRYREVRENFHALSRQNVPTVKFL